jgi:ABC-type multidrug transport system ATPase subunit
MNIISVKRLSKHFNSKIIFNDLNFSINQGQKVAITGASGRGKTTLLKILAGIVPADQGFLKFFGEEFNWQTVKSIRLKIAYLPQGVDILANNGIELLELVGIESSLLKPFLDQLSLNDDVLLQPFSQLSGGEKQRMLTSLIMALDRPLLLLDEPTSALDSKSVGKLMEMIWSNPKLTVVSTSHNPVWEEKCDQIIRL